MFCNHCGSPIAPGTVVCSACGHAALATSVAPLAPLQSRLERHLRTLGILWIVASCLFLFPAIVLILVGSIVHLSIPGTEQLARTLAPFILFLLGSIFFLISVCGIFLGYGLMHHQPWARVGGIILGILTLFHPPFGTALGIYTLWVLLSDDGTQYQRLAALST